MPDWSSPRSSSPVDYWQSFAALTYATNLTGTAKTTFYNGVKSQFAAKAFSSNTTTNGTSSRSFNNGAFNAFSNVWVVGASTVNWDGRIDSFKLKSISYDVGAPVPEPATWMMLILGFGVIGGAMRRLDNDSPFYWAAEIIYANGKFYMYYSVGNEALMEIRVAVSDRPDGGFVNAGEYMRQLIRSDAQAQQDAADDNTGEIVVTATKREQTLQDFQDRLIKSSLFETVGVLYEPDIRSQGFEYHAIGR